MIYPPTFFQCISLHMQALVQEVYDLEKIDKSTGAECQAQVIWIILEAKIEGEPNKRWYQSRGDPNSGWQFRVLGQVMTCRNLKTHSLF